MKTVVVFETMQHLEGYPRTKANLVVARASGKNQRVKITTAEHHKRAADSDSHDDIRVFDETVASTQIIKTSSTEEKSAVAVRVRRRKVKIENSLLTIGIDDVTAQARSSDIP